jgi:pimeloyl-ACP methyl ester carboxylesterase
MEPFRIEVPDAELADLRDRLARVRWAPEPPGNDYGVSGADVRKLVEHWRDGFSWRDVEARLNAHPQFTTVIDGATVHFLHVRSPEPDALPLILTHGWPGSVTEYLDVIGPLTDPRAHGLDPAIAFHLVIPSLPGFGWSTPAPEAGWGPRRVAAAWAVLMARLGYRRYGAAGNDWGSVISPEVGRTAPDSVVGVHVTQIFSGPEGNVPFYPPTVEPASVALLPPDEQALVAGLRHFQRTMASYHHVHAEQPQTLAYALTDSPVGLLAWNSQVMGGLDPDALLAHVAIHWVTHTAGTAPRIYLEDHREPVPTAPTTVPLGLAQFPNDAQAIPTYARRDHANIVSWHVYDRGGHYASQQAPDLYVDDIRQFYARLSS